MHPGTTLGKITDLMHTYVIQNVYYYYNTLHVSSNTALIIRRSNCINTVSVTVLYVSDRPVCRLRRNSSLVVSAALNFLHVDSFRLLPFWDSDPVVQQSSWYLISYEME